MYDTARYAKTRLNDTIVLHKRQPVLIMDIDEAMEAIVINPIQVNGKPFTVPCSELNLLDLNLGFLNRKDSATFMSRKPLRHDWRQGLRVNNVHSSRGRCTTADIARVLLHRYPTFEQACKQVGQGNCMSRAWCAEYAITHLGQIIWRYEAVGTYSKDSGIKLVDNFKFLTPSLKEVTRGCCTVF